MFAENQSRTYLKKVNCGFYYFLLLFYSLIKSFVGIPKASNVPKKYLIGLLSLPHANNVSLLVKNNLYRKLLTARRVLVVNLKHL